MRVVVCLLVLLNLAAGVAAEDYLAAKAAARKLLVKRNYRQALDAFAKLAEGGYSDYQKCDALKYAVQAAIALRKFDEAMKLAKRIPLAPYSKSEMMNVLGAANRFQELIDQFADEKVTEWPDILIGPSLYYRGGAYFKLKSARLAADDLKVATTYPMPPNTAARALILLGDVSDELNKSKEALEAYRRAATRRPGVKAHLVLTAVLREAKILDKRENKPEEALKLLESRWKDVPKGYWLVAFSFSKAALLANAGENTAAIAQYEKTMKLKGISDSRKAECEKEIERLKQRSSKD